VNDVHFFTEEISDWLEPYRLFWSNKLDDLERVLDEE
jgi:hypothetical protein